jgi:histidyl-tRNA synthetase
MFGGGRYDGLISLFIDKKVPAVGFAPGDMTLLDFLTSWNLLPKFKNPIDIFVTVFPENEECRKESYALSQKLREAGLNVEINLNPLTELSKQIKFADKKGVRYVGIIGPDEVSNSKFVIKDLASGTQKECTLDSLRELVFEVRG